MLKRYLRLIGGWSLVIVGIVLLALPGPGLLVILAGFTVLSRESAWAQGMMDKLREYLRSRQEKEAKQS